MVLILFGVRQLIPIIYSSFYGKSAGISGIEISGLYIAAIISTLFMSRRHGTAARRKFNDFRASRITAILLSVSVIAGYFTPWGLLMLGTADGVSLVAILALIGEVKER